MGPEEEQEARTPRPWFTRCRRCRRALKTPESMQVGFGPRCVRLVKLTGAEAEHVRQFFLLPGVAPSGAPPRARSLEWARFWILPNSPSTP